MVTRQLIFTVLAGLALALSAASPEKRADHWAYQPVCRPTVPAIPSPKSKDQSLPVGSARITESQPWTLDFGLWTNNPIDAFVLARLASEKITPSPEAAPENLCRRLYLDLIGLPPSPSEVEAFVRDFSLSHSPAFSPAGGAGEKVGRRESEHAAIERLVDKLLASPQFGVRWARPWLDYAPYADSHGFQRDDFRDLWPYRDWVVNALNADMPFTQFTIEQLAGDLLPNATESQRIATGFNRSAPTNVEAGTDPEETRVNQIHDRVNTLGMIWLGSTLECAQCHDHKYDPISHDEYYQLYAFFNSTSDSGNYSLNPTIEVPPPIATRMPPPPGMCHIAPCSISPLLPTIAPLP